MITDFVGRYLRTVRHLRSDQLAWRIRYRVQRWWEGVSGRALKRRLSRNADRSELSTFVPPDLSSLRSPENPGVRIEELAGGSLTLVGRTRAFAGGEDWHGPESGRTDRLWTITAHYHEWMLDLAEAFVRGTPDQALRASTLLRNLLEDWLDTCRPGGPEFPGLAWNSFAIATRLGSWSRLLGRYPGEIWSEDPALRDRLVRSMAIQAGYLSDHLEWDLRGNHLLRDAVGLAWAGRCLRHPEAGGWLEQAGELAVAQVHEQILPDGGHFERSPMYHIQVMEDFLTLGCLLQEETDRAVMADAWTRMARTLAWLRHPDGDIPLLNDSVLGQAAHPSRMFASEQMLGVKTDPAPRRGGRHLRETGLAVWHGQPWSVFFDVGEVGPIFQPGHAHADTLNVEISYRGRRLVVDAGTYGYDRDRRRSYDRSTASHNTVAVDGESSSEVWHIFRVGARARPAGVEVRIQPGRMTARGSHDGYDRLPGSPRHQRALTVGDGEFLEIVDRITGEGEHRVDGGFLLHPEWTVEPLPGGWLLRDQPETRGVRVSIDGPEELEASVEKRPYHPRFGTEITTFRLSWTIGGFLPVRVHVRFEPVKP